MAEVYNGKNSSIAEHKREMYDIDTGLYAKTYADELIDSYLSSAGAMSDNAVLVVDVDDFTEINDTYGVRFADAELLQLANIVRELFPPDSVFGRVGSDSFIILAKGATAENVYEKAVLLNKMAEDMYAGENEKIKFRVSIAIADTRDAWNYYDLYNFDKSVIAYIKALGGNMVKTYRMANEETNNNVGYIFKRDSNIERGYLEKRLISPNDIIAYSMLLLENAKDIPSSVNLLLRMIAEKFNADRVSVATVDWDTLDFKFEYQWCRNKKDNITGRHSKITVRNYYALSSGYDRRGVRQGGDNELYSLGSLLEAAIYANGRYAGALRIECEKTDYRWSGMVKRELALLANLLGTYLERDKYAHDLRLKEFEMDVMLNATKGGIKVVADDPERTIMRISDGLCELYGYSRDELLGITDGIEENLIYPEDLAAVRQKYGTKYIHDTDSYTLKYRIKCRNGSIKWILDHGRRTFDKDGRAVFYSSCSDVSETENSARQIQELYNKTKASEEFIRIALRNTKTAEFHYYPKEHRCVFPERSCELLGSLAEYKNMPYDLAHDIVSADNRERFINMFNSISKENMTASCTFALKNSDTWIKVTLSAMEDEAKKDEIAVVVGIAEDISDETTIARERMRIIKSISESYFATYHIKADADSLSGISYSAVSQTEELEEIFGTSGDYEFFRETFSARFVHGDAKNGFIEYSDANRALNTLNTKHRVENFEYIHNYGTHTGWVRVSLILVSVKDNTTESYILAFSDINEEKEEEKKRREEHRILSTAISDSYDRIYEVNLNDNTIFDISIADGDIEKEICPMSYEEAVRQMRDKYIPPEDAEEYDKNTSIEFLMKNLDIAKPMHYIEFRMKAYDNDPLFRDNVSEKEYYWKSITYKIIHKSNKNRIMMFISDIDERKTRELEIQQSLKNAFDMIKSANNAKSEFLSKMSHDIRTPMNAIAGMTLIARSYLGNAEKEKDCLDKIEISTKHLLGLINEVLDMSKIESGNMTLKEEEINLPGIIDELTNMIRPQMEKKGHNFKIRKKNLEHEDIMGDSVRIRQVFVNLLSNAVKYTPDHGLIELEVTELPSKAKGMAHFEFVIRDNGIGMSKKYCQTVFEPFTRAEDSRTSKIQGTGLGMTITKQLVNLMNGDISVKSELNKGSEFTVDVSFKLTKHDYENQKMLTGRRILVISENNDSGKDIANNLKMLELEVYLAAGLSRAETIIDEMGYEADDFIGVILDAQYSSYTKEELRQIKCAFDKPVPIILTSEEENSGLEGLAADIEAEGYIQRPIFASHLVKLCLKPTQEKPKNEDAVDAVNNTDFSGKRVLLVEDNSINMEILAEILSFTNVETDEAENGQIAYEKVRDNPEGYYDIVLMDVQMPVMNGYESTRAIRALDREDVKTLPIIACTANAFLDDINNAKDAGMNEHISKPIDYKELMRIMNKWLN